MTVTVIIPVYNSSQYILEAITSCLIQQEVAQIIVVDDASIDNTVHIVKTLKDERIVLLQKSVNEGASAARNFAFPFVKGDIVSFLDADDYFEQKRFSLPLELLKESPNMMATFESVENFYVEGCDQFRPDLGRYIDFNPSCKYEHIFDEIISDKVPFFSIISLVMRKSIIESIKFDTDLRMEEDKEFIYQLLRNFEVGKCVQNEVKIKRRLHFNNTTRVGNESIIKSANHLLDKWYDKTVVEKFTPHQTRIFFYRKLCKVYVEQYGITWLLHRVFTKFKIGVQLCIQNPILVKKMIF